MPAFLAPVDYTVGSVPTDVKLGDFNGDAIPDLATASYGSPQRQRAAGQRRRHVPAGSQHPRQPVPLSLAVGDFNDDGKLDLATRNDYETGEHGIMSCSAGATARSRTPHLRATGNGRPRSPPAT